MALGAIGTVITGTLEADKVIRALVTLMEELGGNPELVKLAQNALVIGFRSDDEVAWGQAVIDALQSALHNLSPAYAYFGSHPTNPTNIGFWPNWEEIDALPASNLKKMGRWVLIYEDGREVARYAR